MPTKRITHPFYKVIASFMWVSAIPVVILLYTYMPTHWLEILGLSLSVWHVWTKILSYLHATLLSISAYRKQAHYDKDNQLARTSEPVGVECETATIWAV